LQISESCDGSVDMPMEDFIDLISNERRRLTISILCREGREVDLGEVCVEIASIENSSSENEVNSKQRKRIYTPMIQIHLPRMDEWGCVEYDYNSKTLEKNELTEQVMSKMEDIRSCCLE